MIPPHEHSVWALIFEQTPVVLRWVLGILTLGISWLIGTLYTNHRERVNRLENLIIANGDKTNEAIKGVHDKIDTLTLKLVSKK